MHPTFSFVLDEGDAIPDEIYRAIESCMSGGFSRLLVMFNPKRRMGAVYRMIRDGKCSLVSMKAFDHPNVVTGKEVIVGAVTRDKTITRINEWTVPVNEEEGDELDNTCFEVPDYLVGATTTDTAGNYYPPLDPGHRKIVEAEFSYMVLGEYPTQSMYQLISTDWIDAARTRWDAYVAQFGLKPPVAVKAIMGLDAADLGEDYNTLCTRYGGFLMDIKRWHGMDIAQTANRASLFYHERGCEIINVDSTGVGAGIAPNIELQNIDYFAKSVKIL